MTVSQMIQWSTAHPMEALGYLAAASLAFASAWAAIKAAYQRVTGRAMPRNADIRLWHEVRAARHGRAGHVAWAMANLRKMVMHRQSRRSVSGLRPRPAGQCKELMRLRDDGGFTKGLSVS